MQNITEFHIFMQNMNEFNQLILDILDKENDFEESFQNLNKYFEDHKIFQDKDQMKIILHAISSISDNHHRGPDHFCKIERILKILSNSFKNFFSNIEIFEIFKENKRILLFLFEEKIITSDENIFNLISTDKYIDRNYNNFFLPEFSTFYDEEYLTKYGNNYKSIEFQEKRKIGENDNEICSIIRNDLIDEFIKKVENERVYLGLKESIFETNPLLYNKKVGYLEYSAFYGSIKIFKNLLTNEYCSVKASLLPYAVHSNNIELIHLVEELLEKEKEKNENSKDPFWISLYKERNEQDFNDELNDSLLESLKSHHFIITNHLLEKYFNENDKIKNQLPLYCLRFYNFINFNNQSIKNLNDMLCVLCECDYILLVELLLKSKDLNVNSIFVFKINFFDKISI